MPFITKQYKFCAAHKYWNEKWDEEKNIEVFDDDVRLHGHNYDLYVTIKGPINSDSGFVVDLKYLNKIVNKKVLDILDHSLIQDNEWFTGKQPSTENLVVYMWNQISPEISSPAKLFCIKLRETGTIFTEYYGEEIE
jgi:6-pyruvoyltetrahydropterin/6-carboxytetrahydropterin synthase